MREKFLSFPLVPSCFRDGLGSPSDPWRTALVFLPLLKWINVLAYPLAHLFAPAPSALLCQAARLSQGGGDGTSLMFTSGFTCHLRYVRWLITNIVFYLYFTCNYLHCLKPVEGPLNPLTHESPASKAGDGWEGSYGVCTSIFL